MVMEEVHQGFIGLSRQNCRFHELLVPERAKPAADPAMSSVAKESPVQGRREKSPKHAQIFSVPLSAQSFYA